MPLNLLLILASAAVAILFGRAQLPWWWLPGLALAFLVTSAAVIMRAAPLKGAEPKQPDRIETERLAGLGIYSVALTLAAANLILNLLIGAWALGLLGLAAAWTVLWLFPELRTVSRTRSIAINRDPAVVFAFMSNCENEPSYWSTIESVEKITPGPTSKGTQFRSRVKFSDSVVTGGWAMEAIEDIEYEPNRSYTSSVIWSDFDGRFRPRPNVGETTFQESSDGTLVRYRYRDELDYRTCLLGGIFLAPSARRQSTTKRQTAWSNLKQILETEDTT